MRLGAELDLATRGPAIQIKNLVKTYSSANKVGRQLAYQPRSFFQTILGNGVRDILALDHVSFDVNEGEVFGLLGPNGSGKTSLIKILSTLVLPDSGEVLVEGVDVVKKPHQAVKQLQTVLSETVGFERRLTGRQNLEFFAELFGVPRPVALQRIESLLTFAGLQDRADIMFQRYSTGMARKLLMCRALLSDASVLLFDEPTSALDPVSASEFRSLIKNVLAKERGKTILVATHNLWEAENLCDRIALLRKGSIIASGTPSEIRRGASDKVNISIAVSNIDAGSGEMLLSTLRAMKGIHSVEIEASEDGSPHANLFIEGEREIDYTAIFTTILGMGMGIVSLESSHPTLEEAFLKLNREAAS